MATPPARCVNRIQVAKAIETGSIGSRTIVNPAWACLNVEDLLSRVNRISNYLAAGFAGRTARRYVRDQLDGTLRFFFDGVQDRTGADHPDVYSGLEINRRDFVDNVVEPPTAADTRPLSLTAADGTTLTADIQLGEFRWAYTGIPGIARATLAFTLPLGKLTEA